MSETIQIKKDTFYKGTIVVLAILLIVSLFTGGFGISGQASKNTGATNTGTDTGGNTGANADTSIITDNPDLFPSLGPSDAAVTVIELADFQCPYCSLASGFPDWASQYQSQYGSLIGSAGKAEQMAESGEIRFIYVPLAFLGEESTNAAEAAFCAQDQGKFWEMHDAIFTASDGPSENTGKYSKENLKVIAQGVSGLDQSAFADCLDNDKNLAKVNSVMTKAQSAGFQISTPQFWVNGQQVQASWTAIQSAINSA